MDMCHSRFAQSLATLDRVGECQVSFILNSLIYDARNKFCQQAIEGEFDYILWLDSDMVFPSYVLRQISSPVFISGGTIRSRLSRSRSCGEKTAFCG